MTQAPGEHTPVDSLERSVARLQLPVEIAFFTIPSHVARAEHRGEGQRDQCRGRDRTRSHQAELAKKKRSGSLGAQEPLATEEVEPPKTLEHMLQEHREHVEEEGDPPPSYVRSRQEKAKRDPDDQGERCDRPRKKEGAKQQAPCSS